MREHGITPLLGPALVAYLVADLAALEGGLDLVGKLIAGLAVALSLSLLWAARHRERSGATRVGYLGFGAGLSLVPATGGGDALSLTADITGIAGHCLCAAMALDLAIDVPDRVPWLVRRQVRPWPQVLIALSGVASLVGVLSPAPLLAAGIVLPATVDHSARYGLLAAIGAALWLRHRRPAMGSDPGALAANTWGLLGLWPAALASLVIAVADAGSGALSALGTPAHGVVRFSACLVALSLTFSHLRLVDPSERVRVGAATRAGLSALLCGALVFGATQWLWGRLPPAGRVPAYWVLPALLLGQLLWRIFRPLSHRLLAPAHGALLDAMAEATVQLGRDRHFEDFARTVLSALRGASGDPYAQPRLYTFDPPRNATIDAAAQVQVGSAEISPVLLSHIRQAPGEIVLRAPLQAQEVRQPALRPIVEVLRELDALCVVPLVDDGELEGVMVVPSGDRHATLALEELQALRAFSAVVAAHLASLGAEARAQARAGQALLQAERAAERIEQLQEDVARLQADARVLRAGRAADRVRVVPVAYGPAMRKLLGRLEALASTDAPVLLVAEGGTPVEALAYQVHTRSGRGQEAFVVGDCGALRPEEAAETLFGGAGAGQPGLLRLAAEGTLVLLDVPALPTDVQAQLAESLASRRACGGGAADSYEVTARVVATARVQVSGLIGGGHFDAELAARLSPSELRVPPLRERPEDMASLLLIALDRAARIMGRDPVGIDPQAQRLLLAHDWPGNQRELQSVVDRAVARCQGERVMPADLPPLHGRTPGAPQQDEAAEGTLEAVERAALRRALQQAGGNKSEAARLLGLKRTTFLDKLRRHRLEEGGRASTPAN